MLSVLGPPIPCDGGADMRAKNILAGLAATIIGILLAQSDLAPACSQSTLIASPARTAVTDPFNRATRRLRRGVRVHQKVMGHAASARNRGYHRRNTSSNSLLSTFVRICSSK